jgi:hypothetical protein
MVLMLLAALLGLALFRDGVTWGGVLLFALAATIWFGGRHLFSRLLELP